MFKLIKKKLKKQLNPLHQRFKEISSYYGPSLILTFLILEAVFESIQDTSI
jgi:hypothetical protein